MRYILILTALLVLIGVHSEASEPIQKLSYALNDPAPLKIDPSAGSVIYTKAKLIQTQETPAQHAPTPAFSAQPHPTPGTDPDSGEFPLSTSSIFILFCGLIGMLAIRRNFTP